MIRTQVYIPDDLHHELMLLAQTEGVNYSTLIREGAREAVQKRLAMRRKKSKAWGKGFIGAGKTTKRTDAVQDIQNYYLHGVAK